eukprot:TRINITY_DN3069_c0_g1_i11.p1 TRINITY_DN3069_c0_g1~~TRINITY_DN3069_c0_g1_i11.p1  ORF type:complete len:542 (-),score=104.00 TRINITY_DN3069_c0_g1_i11:976-2601(-)
MSLEDRSIAKPERYKSPNKGAGRVKPSSFVGKVNSRPLPNKKPIHVQPRCSERVSKTLTNRPSEQQIQEFLQRINEKERSPLPPPPPLEMKLASLRTLLSELKMKQEQLVKLSSLPNQNKPQQGQPPKDQSLPSTELAPEVLSNFSIIQQIQKPVFPFLDAQEEELVFLRNLLGVRLRESSVFPKRISINLSTSSLGFPRELSLSLIITLPPHYPSVSPIVTAISTELVSQVSLPVLDLFSQFLNFKARAMLGRCCISDLLRFGEDWLIRSPQMKLEASFVTESFHEPEGHVFGDAIESISDGDYQIFTADNLLCYQWNQVTSLKETLPLVSTANIIVLLKFFKWDKNLLLKTYLFHSSAGTLEDFYTKAGILTGLLTSESWKEKVEELCARPKECPGCLDEFGMEKMATLPCCHLYCLSCLRSYVSLQLSGGLGSSTIKCPGFECPYELDETFLAELLDREDYVKYLRFVVNSNVQNDSRLNWCPGLGCNRVIMRSRPYGVVMCTCGYLWCWSCRDEGHWPASCEQQKWWTEVYCKNEFL